MTRSRTIRVFAAVGITPTPELISLLAELGECGSDVRPSSVQQLHITLKFVGAIETRLVPEVIDAVDDAAHQFDLDKVELTRLDAFPSRADAKVLWVDVSPTNQLSAAAKQISRALQPVGVAADSRKFIPHMTVARLKRPAPEVALETQKLIGELYASTASLGQTSISQIRLYQSDFVKDSGRPTYSILHQATSPKRTNPGQ